MNELAVSTRGLARGFAGVKAVDGIDLRVPRGSIYGFLGPNGAGKTTTIRLLLGLIRPDAGEVEIFGLSLRRQRAAILRRLGALVEEPSLYPNLSGRENLEVTRRLSGGKPAQIERALTIVRLQDAADRLVGGYSTGMRQRLGLALALLNEPQLLILDEPTNGLDPSGIQEMRELLCRLRREQGITILLSSHILSEVEQVATHIGIIQQGRLRFQGTLDDLHAHTDEQVVLGVDQVERAKALLQQNGWTVTGNGGQRLAVSANGRSDAVLINSQLVRQGVSIFHLSLSQPTLEDIFVSLTHDESGNGHKGETR